MFRTQQPRSARSRWLLGMAAASVSLAAVAGCEKATDKADLAVTEKLDMAAAVNLTKADGPATAHGYLDAAAKETDASPQLQARAKALLADAELRQATEIAATAAGTADRADRVLRDLRLTTASIAADNRLIAALNKADPAPVLTALTAEKSAMTGSDEKPDWKPTDPVTLASMSAADKAAAALQQQADQLQQQIKTKTDQRTELLTKADQLQQQSRTQKGAAALDLYTQGATARKDADDLAANLSQDQSALARTQADLAVQQAQQAAIKASVGNVDAETGKTTEAWTAVGERVKTIKAHSQSLLGDPSAVQPPSGKDNPETKPGTVADRSAQLADLQKRTRDLRGEADTHYNNAIGFYKDAFDRATAVKTTLGDPAHLGSAAERPDRADLDAWKIEKSALEPAHFRYLQATAQLSRAEFHARAADDARSADAVATAMKPVFEAATLTVPTTLDDATGDFKATAKKESDLAVAGFKDAVENLGKVTDGDAPADLKQAAHVSTALAHYGWGLLLKANGDEPGADGQREAARAARSLAAAGTGPLPPMPPGLEAPAPMMPAGTVPATSPAAAPSTPSATPDATPPAATPATPPANTP